MNSVLRLTTPLADAEAAFRRGDIETCLTLCHETIAIVGRTSPTLHLLGSALVRAGEESAGLRTLEEALALTPDCLTLRIDTASAMTRLDKLDQALEILVDGAHHHPGHPDLAARLATLLSDHGRHDEALAVLTAGVHATPADLPLRGLLAAELAGAFRLDEALEHLHRFDRLAPGRSEIQVNIGVLHQSRGDLEQAIAYYERAIRLMPDNGLAHVNLATALLSRLDLTRGFREFEWRLTLPTVRRPPTRAAAWSGDDLAGRHLLLTAEQGFGDMIQFARFLPLLRTKGGRVTVECPRPLARLLATMNGVDACIMMGETLPDADVTASLLSLPFLMGCGAGTLASAIPYLAHASGAPRTGALKVGLIWAGLPATGEVFIRRSLNRRFCRLTDLAPLASVPDVQFHSLQIGPAAAEIGNAAFPLIDLTGGITDFADTAARMAELDLVISVDTAAAHLAGAMGVPLWVLLAPGQSDYRWGMGERSPWYPDARLFRAGPAGWSDLADTVAAALQALTAESKRLNRQDAKAPS